jgi:chromosome segregation ATPase
MKETKSELARRQAAEEKTRKEFDEFKKQFEEEMGRLNVEKSKEAQRISDDHEEKMSRALQEHDSKHQQTIAQLNATHQQQVASLTAASTGAGEAAKEVALLNGRIEQERRDHAAQVAALQEQLHAEHHEVVKKLKAERDSIQHNSAGDREAMKRLSDLLAARDHTISLLEAQVRQLNQQIVELHCQVKDATTAARSAPSSTVSSGSDGNDNVVPVIAKHEKEKQSYFIAIRTLNREKHTITREVNKHRTVLWVLFAVFTIFIATSDALHPLRSLTRYA